jgi:O-antigen/teichoic acid export membrane protein
MYTKDNSIRAQAVLNFIGRAISFLINVATPIILVRLFLPEEFGQYKQVIMVHQLLITILSFNIPGSVLYFYPKEKSREGRRIVLSNVTFMLSMVSTVFFIAAIMLKNIFFINIDNPIIEQYFYLIVINAVMEIVASPLDSIFIAEEKALTAMTYYIINQLFRVIILIGAIVIYQTVYSAIFALMLFSILRALFLISYLMKSYRIGPSAISKVSIMAQLQYVAPLGVSMIAGTISRHAEKIILLTYFTATDFAIYSVGNYGIPIGILYLSVGNVILPQISKSQDALKSYSLWKKMVIANAIVTIPIVIYFLIMSKYFILQIFGTEYVDSVPVFNIILLTLPFQMLGHGYILRGLGETKYIFYARIIKMLVSVILGLVIIRHYGVVGAALTYFTSFVVNVFLQLRKTRLILKLKWLEFIPWKDFIQLSIITVLLSTLPYSARELSSGNILLLVISSVLYFTLFAAYIFKSKYADLIPVNLFKGANMCSKIY